MFICICGRLETLTLYLRQLRVLVLKCASAVQTMEYVNHCFFRKKGGVQINRMCELLEILW